MIWDKMNLRVAEEWETLTGVSEWRYESNYEF